MAIRSRDVHYSTVHKAISNNYECLGITCADVGGLFDETTRKYYDGEHPCEDAGSGLSTGAIVAIVFGVLAGICSIICCLLIRSRELARKRFAMPPDPEEIMENRKETDAKIVDDATEIMTPRKNFDIV
jgi:hypothetical protein